MTISVVIITYKRIQELKETIDSLLEEKDAFDELILVDNCSMDGTKEYGIFLEQQEEKVKFYSLDSNLGVAGGRNYAIEKATGDILVFLDDDAVFENQGCFSKIRQVFSENEKLGALAFRIINFYTGEMRSEEIPFTNKHLNLDEERLTSSYIGAGHAILKTVFEKCGDYPKDYFYGVEELDLSFRIIDTGYEILYYPTVRVLHKQVKTARVTNREKWIMAYRNRMLTSYRYLGIPYRLVIGTLLFGKIMILSRSISAPWKGLMRYQRDKKQTAPRRVGKEAIRYMKANYGRLWL